MTFPGLDLFPGADVFPASPSTPDAPVGPSFPYLSVGSWQSSGLDTAGVLWVLTALDGWYDPPPARGDFPVRPAGNGAFDGVVYDDPRIVTWSGAVRAPDPLSCSVARRTLGVLARAARDGVFVVGHMIDGDTAVRGKRSGGWNVAMANQCEFDYQATVICPDPYRYGPTVTASTGMPVAGAGGLVFPLFNTTGRLEFGAPGVSGQVTLANPGTTEAYLTFTVTGSALGGVTVTDVGSGRAVTFVDDVPLGAVLVVDSNTGRATLNGADRTGSLTSRQWWSVPAGGSSTVQFNTLSFAGQSGQLTASLRPAYE